ncbi:MAG: tRNA epoxyqueuosine(34) reductase QueG, partial [Bacteroidales bacterium]
IFCMSLSAKIKVKAKQLGFDACGIAQTAPLAQETIYLKKYIANQFHADMAYMARNMDKRCNPKILMPQAESVVVVLMNYGASVFGSSSESLQNAPGISVYAQADDYHKVLKNRLFLLQEYCQNEIPHLQSRCFVDTAPIMEKAWAERAGLGWIGRHGLLLHPDFGSYCFIGILLCSVPLTYDRPLDLMQSPCASCVQSCLHSCPTGALLLQGGLNASKCLSYASIESESIAIELQSKMSLFYGCDSCQKNCVFNLDCIKSGRMFSSRMHPEFQANSYLLGLTPEQWLNMNDEEFNTQFAESPLLRLGLKKIQRNIKIVYFKN